MDKSFRLTSNRILGESSPNIPRRSKKGPSASTSSNLRAKDSKTLIPQSANASAKKLSPSPNKTFVLFKIRSHFEKKYPSFGIEKYLTQKAPDEDESLQKEKPLLPEQEQDIIDQLREAKRSKSLLRSKEKYAYVPQKVDSNLHSPSRTLSAISPQQTAKQRISRTSSPLKHQYNSDNGTERAKSPFSNPPRKKEVGSYSSVERENSVMAPTAHSFHDHYRPKTVGTVNNVHDKSAPQSRLLSTNNSKETLLQDNRTEKKERIEVLANPTKFTRLFAQMNENQSFKQSSDGMGRTSQSDDNTKYKYFYQKYKDPRNRQMATPRGLSKNEGQGSTNSLLSANNSCLGTIQEKRETTMASQRKARFYKSYMSPDKSRENASNVSPDHSEINIQEGKEVNYSFMGSRHSKLHHKTASLNAIQKNILEMKNIKKNTHKMLFKDSSQNKLDMMENQMKRDYSYLKKNMKKANSGHYDFEGFIKKILDRSSHRSRTLKKGISSLNNENINQINLISKQ